MKTINLDYTYISKWRTVYNKLWESLPDFIVQPSVWDVYDGIILPSVKDEKLFWGKGGVLDSNGELIMTSVVKGAFGGKYDISDFSVNSIDCPVIYLGILPLHWGHFLIDFLCRLYILSRGLGFKLAYIPRYFDGQITGSFKECLELLDVNPKDMIRIECPTKVKRIIIPENSMGYSTSFSPEIYRSIIQNIKKNACEKISELNLCTYERIYFTRSQFSSDDIGEKEIELNFDRNGFKVLAPEKLSLLEQIHYIGSARVIASIGGTITHNYMFANKDSELIFLNRFPKPNPPQFRINYIFDLDVTMIDVYNKWHGNKNLNYGDPHIWVEVSSELKCYFKDHQMDYDSFYYQTYFGNYLHYFYKWEVLPFYWKVRASLGKIKKSIYGYFKN